MKKPEEIFLDYYNGVYKYLRGICADEELAQKLSQDTFFRASKSINNYNGETNVRHWLLDIIRYKYFFYKRETNRLTGEEKERRRERSYQNFEKMIKNKEIAPKLYKVLNTIQEPYREVYMLRMFGGMSFKDIGNAGSKSERWAITAFHRANMMVNEGLKEESK